MELFIVIAVVSGICILNWFRKVFTGVEEKAEGDLFKYIRGNYLDLTKCVVHWGWMEPTDVGEALSFNVEFFYGNGSPYPVCEADRLKVKISTRHFSDIPHVVEFGETKENVVSVSFTVRRSGAHEISITLANKHVCESPFKKVFIPGPMNAEHSCLVRTAHTSLSVITMTQATTHKMAIEACDEFGNSCSSRLNKHDFENAFNLSIMKCCDSVQYPAFTWEITCNKILDQLTLCITVFEEGSFQAELSYQSEPLKNGIFDILVLTSSESQEVKTNVSKQNLSVWFECRLLVDTTEEVYTPQTSQRRGRALSMGDTFTFPQPSYSRSRIKSSAISSSKPRKVYCYITPKQLVIREYFLKIFHKRLYTFRVSPATKVTFGGHSSTVDQPILIISDGFQPNVVLACQRSNVLAATFVEIIHNHMGRSESFEEKMKYFHTQLVEHHDINVRHRNRIDVNVDRDDLLNSSYKATKHFSTSDWCRQFVVAFKGETGLDWGGVNREWIHLLCKIFFQSKDAGGCGIFRSMKEDAQALVLPASDSEVKIKHFEFAGKLVGKCLLESAVGGEYARQVTARFARSFLAQLIGLPATFAHFESDDPDLYMSKVKYILEHDVTDAELTFSEEQFTSSGSLSKVIDLVPNGANVAVTNDNKIKYLNRIAQYRLSESIKNELALFIKGLTSIVPDHLLSVFDENELELVMCGSSKISPDDFKLHCVVNSGMDPTFQKILSWFWSLISTFTQDELARLLQFTTGCSQLPPDGFKALEPKFKISSIEYKTGGLPMAHTCFNELCLPNYESYDDLHKMLKISITEGITGFGLV
nr:apoptosis-resistant E3 ubiquitin protein ligase 1 [Ciona intestinalis]|eukprot:XP_002122623.3 apoptosis-resistant E3 ubiquitin protein ligase 1 [Ciona intestinalis]